MEYGRNIKPVGAVITPVTRRRPDNVWRQLDADALVICEDCRHAFMASDSFLCPNCESENISET